MNNTAQITIFSDGRIHVHGTTRPLLEVLSELSFEGEIPQELLRRMLGEHDGADDGSEEPRKPGDTC